MKRLHFPIRSKHRKSVSEITMVFEAWLDEGSCIVSFHEIPDSRYYSAEEHDFWKVIVGLIMTGYRVQ